MLEFHIAVGFIWISTKFSDASLRRKLPPSVTIRRIRVGTPRILTPCRDSVDETRARVTYQKLVTR